jgi:hypothetical protein
MQKVPIMALASPLKLMTASPSSHRHFLFKKVRMIVVCAKACRYSLYGQHSCGDGGKRGMHMEEENKMRKQHFALGEKLL